MMSDFIQMFFHGLIHVYSPGAKSDSPQGTDSDVNRNVLSLRSVLQVSNKISLRSDFIQNVFMI